MSLLRRRAKSRSCFLHGDNGCELQGEAGTRERAQDTRSWRSDIADEWERLAVDHVDLGPVLVARANGDWDDDA